MIINRLAEEGRRVVAAAADRAVLTPPGVVTIVHLLRGLHAVPESHAAQVLMEYSLTPVIIDEILEELSLEPTPATEFLVGTLRFDADSDAALQAAVQLSRTTGVPAGADLVALGALVVPSASADELLTRARVLRIDLRRALADRLSVRTEHRPAATAAAAPRTANPVPPIGAARHPTGAASSTPTLDSLAVNLTARARDGRLDPIVGRDAEIRRAVSVLCRRSKANPVLVGDAGVGKTAVVEGLAQIIADGHAPAVLEDRQIYALDVAALVAGTTYRGDLEKRLRQLIGEVNAAGNVLLFIDEIHTIIGAGAGSSALGTSDMLKPLIARGELQIIGATTRDEYVRHIESDPALERRFTAVAVDEPTLEQALEMISIVAPNYEDFHGVHYSLDALRAAVTLSDRYIADRQLPDKAIDLLDEAAATRQIACSPLAADDTVLPSDQSLIDADDIAQIVRSWTGIPVDARHDEVARLREAETILGTSVIGQDVAVRTLATALRRRRSGVSDATRPTSALAVGPSGVGKSHLAHELARLLFDSPDSVVRIDMSEYMEAHSVSRLIGSPPGYVGHGNPGQLTEPVRRRPYSVVLLDEIDKAHPRVLDVLLQVLDSGRLTDAKGRTVNFSHCVLFMTANAAVPAGSSSIGFSSLARTQSDRADRYRDDLRKTYRPEFINRIDQVLVFDELGLAERTRIARLNVEPLATRLTAAGVELVVADDVYTLLAQRDYDPAYGVRPLRRAIQGLVEDPVAEILLDESAVTAIHVTVSSDGTTLAVTAQ